LGRWRDRLSCEKWTTVEIQWHIYSYHDFFNHK
jgi:hypothetical protein